MCQNVIYIKKLINKKLIVANGSDGTIYYQSHKIL